MHLDILVEGIEHDMQAFIKWWSTRTVPMLSKLPDGQVVKSGIQLGLRERKAFTLIFPEEALDIVLNTLRPENCEVSMVDGKGTKRWGTTLNWIRRILRLKPLPVADLKKGTLPIIDFPNMRVVALGTRTDGDVTEVDGSTHEGL